jgi:hypothetical protein
MNLFNIFLDTLNNQYKEIFYLSMFFGHFSISSFRNQQYESYSWKKLIKHKFFILKNFYFHSDIDDSTKDKMIEIFYQAQRRLFALYKFKHLYFHKYKKYKGQQIDLNFNELQENDKNSIILIHNKNKVLFNIFDLIKIICTSLSFECSFFSEPKLIKNPWDNSSFSLSNLYNIYFFIKKSTIEMPILLLRFFQSSFSLNNFKDENQFIIKQYIINNYKNLDNNKKYNYIKKMFEFYNNLVIQKDQIIIDPLFPVNKLISIFQIYIKTFLLSKFSYESDIRIKNKCKLKKMLKDFKKKQPLFGRRFVSTSINKLYCISELKYKYNHFFFTNCYIPPKEMIILNNKSFFIDFNPNLNHNYTIFPSLEHCNQFSSNTYHITGLHSFIKSVKFTEAQNKIIQSEFKPIFVKIKNDNQNQRIRCEEIPQSPFNVGTFLELISRMDNIQIQIERRHENSIIESEDESIDDDQTLVEQFDELQIHDTDSDIDSENSDEYMESDSEN